MNSKRRAIGLARLSSGPCVGSARPPTRAFLESSPPWGESGSPARGRSARPPARFLFSSRGCTHAPPLSTTPYRHGKQPLPRSCPRRIHCSSKMSFLWERLVARPAPCRTPQQPGRTRAWVSGAGSEKPRGTTQDWLVGRAERADAFRGVSAEYRWRLAAGHYAAADRSNTQ